MAFQAEGRFSQEGAVAEGRCWVGQCHRAHHEPVALSHGSGTRCRRDGRSSEGSCKRGPVWDEPPWEQPMDTCDTQSCFFLFLSPPSQCLSQGSTNEVSGSCSPHAAGASRALGSWEKHLGPKSMSGLVEDGSHKGLGQQLLAWLALAVPCDPDAWARVWMWALHSRHFWEPSGREIWVGNEEHIRGYDGDFHLSPSSSVWGFSCCARRSDPNPRLFWSTSCAGAGRDSLARPLHAAGSAVGVVFWEKPPHNGLS